MHKENKNRMLFKPESFFKFTEGKERERKGKVQGENNPHTHFQAINS